MQSSVPFLISLFSPKSLGKYDFIIPSMGLGVMLFHLAVGSLRDAWVAVTWSIPCASVFLSCWLLIPEHVQSD